jgi:Leucine-rich repeat (LRR) protein
MIVVSYVCFRESRGLLTLELQKNPLEAVEGPFLESESLLNLDLRECGLTSLNKWFFSRSTNLKTLDLSGNRLVRLEEGPFEPLTTLKHLKLNRCGLTRISDNAFSGMVALDDLELSGNDLKGGLDWTVPLVALESLDLRKSGVDRLEKGAFTQNTHLKRLVLGGNDIGELEGAELGRLEHLDLSETSIGKTLSENTFRNISRLHSLVLRDTSLSGEELSLALTPLSSLTELDVRNCGLTGLPRDSFQPLHRLAKLDLSDNPVGDSLTSLLFPLSNLRRLDMSRTGLRSIPRTTFSNLSSLDTLDLSGNLFETLDDGIFDNATLLRSLHMKGCGLPGLSPSLFLKEGEYPAFEELRLSGNPLRVDDEKGLFLPDRLSRLRTLDLTDCGLSHLPRGSLESFPELLELVLANNSLHNLTFLGDVPNLRSLDLRYNSYEEVDPRAFAGNPDLSALMLVGNPWVCDCKIADMWEWAVVVKGGLAVLRGAEAESSSSRPPLTCTPPGTPPPHPRSWDVFVKFSLCDSAQRLTPQMLLAPSQPMYSDHTSYSLLLVALLILSFAALILLVTSCNRYIRNCSK